jgi:rhamnosyltransferase
LNNPKVIAVVVALNPEKDELQELLEATLPQVDQIIVIDNGSGAGNLDWLIEFIKDRPIELHSLSENYGIATAQNKGIAVAKKYAAEYVVLFDHDSLPAPDMVAKLLAATLSKESLGQRVGAVGPFYEDPRRLVPSQPFVDLDGVRFVRRKSNKVDLTAPVSHVISSGALISMATLDAVGHMKEELFIDFVDIEWALRARHLGYPSFGVWGALMQHSLGDQRRFIFGKSFRSHSPHRHYYQFRNAIWIYRQPYLSLSNKLGESWRLFKRFIACAIFVEPRKENLKMMLLGLAHGITGRLGKL